MSFIRIVMHHTLHKTNNILSKFLLFSPKQVKDTSDANRYRINTRSQTGNPIRNNRPSCPPTTGPGLRPESRRENYLNDQPRCPPTTDPGLIPETARETLSETTALVVLRQLVQD